MFYYDGKLEENNYIQLDINDSTWLYGATVFTTLRVYQKSLNYPLTNWQNHCDRLKISIKEFDWIMPDWQKNRRRIKLSIKLFSCIKNNNFSRG
jgi:4-amino-4-deoxychorismate lyase